MSETLSFLVIEDDDAVARIVVRALSVHGIVHRASTCAEARLHLGAQRYDAMVSDVQLPDGDGLDVVAEGTGRNPYMCVLVLTGVLDHQVIDRVHALGAKYLLKPAFADQLERLVRETRERKQAGERRIRVVVERWTTARGLSEAERELLELGCTGVKRESYPELREVKPDTIKKQVSALIRKTGHDTFDHAVAAVLREAASEP